MACRRLVARSAAPFSSFLRSSKIVSLSKPFSTTQCLSSSNASSGATITPQTPSQKSSVLDILTDVGNNLGGGATSNGKSPYGLTSPLDKYRLPEDGPRRFGDDEYHLHVYSTKHNTHITLSDQERRSIISLSCGNLGFRKSQRGTYDAGFQLMSYVLSRIQQQGLMSKIYKLELCLRGFGQGREAVTRVLLGASGTRLRESIVRVVDKTRLKIGGNRSPKPRRL